MYRRLPDLDQQDDHGAPVAVSIDGRPHAARRGDTVAATLLAAGLDACRTTPVGGVPRGPYCMMGVCFDCLVVIDGQPNRQGCMILVEDGMRIERQQGARSVDVDPSAPSRMEKPA
jgi:predicted molibdopterin-dependent oxidoreductase YjgC